MSNCAFWLDWRKQLLQIECDKLMEHFDFTWCICAFGDDNTFKTLVLVKEAIKGDKLKVALDCLYQQLDKADRTVMIPNV